MLTVRPMRSEDLAACARVLAENDLWRKYNVTHESALERLRSGFEQHADILVAEQNDQPLGFVWYVLRGAFQRSGYIMLIGVDPAAQGLGVGSALLSAAEAQMAASVKDVFLLVSDFNTRAQAFYQHHGYQPVGAVPDYVLPGIAELIYRKSLVTG